jgi:hypothetical protein
MIVFFSMIGFSSMIGLSDDVKLYSFKFWEKSFFCDNLLATFWQLVISRYFRSLCVIFVDDQLLEYNC